MRWALAAVVVMWSVVASAQTMTIPAHFTKSAGGDAYKALARKGDTIAVQLYRGGDAELATIAWQWRSEAPTRSGLGRFEHELAGRARPDGAREVSNTALFDRDPMQVEVFDTLGGQRIYHRRLYAVDAKNLVHVWWTVCTAPATAIEQCEQAQRTMKLDVAHAITLPAEPPPPPRSPTPSAGAFNAPDPDVDPDRPGTIVVPAGYRELQTGKLDDLAGQMRMLGRVDEMSSRMFAPPDDSVRLLQITLRLAGDRGSPREFIRELDRDLTNGTGAPRVVDAEVVSEIHDDKLERRTLYALDKHGELFAFTVACYGAAGGRGECVRALATMRLRVLDQLAPTDPEWDRDPHRSALGQLVLVLLVVVVPLAGILWVAKSRSQRRRRRRAPILGPVE